MQHLIFSCLESRVEDNGALFGRYLLGPLRVGQATTVATALRRALLSEVRGIGITAVEIKGASHQYSSIKGVRESALDIILNLKQVVLTGTIAHDLPAIGHIDVQGPKAVIANDLLLPNGICCVNPNQPIAMLSATGLLKIKCVISAGKSRLTPYIESAHTVSEQVFQPKTRSAEIEELPLYQRKRLRQRQNKSFQKLRREDTEFLLHRNLWGKKNNLILYSKKRRSGNLQKIITGLQEIEEGSNFAKNSDFEMFQTLKPVIRLTAQKEAKGSISEGNRSLKEVDLSPLKGKRMSTEASKRFNKRLTLLRLGATIKKTSKPVFLDKNLNKFVPHSFGEETNVEKFGPRHMTGVVGKPFGGVDPSEDPTPLKLRDLEKNEFFKTPTDPLSRSVLPVNPVFTPITKVNFAIQIDDQWQEPRERIILEVWSNGSINPRQAIREAASNLVYLFSLLR